MIHPKKPPSPPVAALLTITGRVQGVGYRPFVYRMALEHNIKGWVRNETGRVLVRAEGAPTDLDDFCKKLIEQAPPLARPHLQAREPAATQGHDHFLISKSEAAAEPDIHIPPDYFTCDDCLLEMSDPAERRHRYPFINCTQCGPRYTIIENLPYDRPNTSLKDFPLCADCAAEYDDPADRRFHAQPLACPVCGPELVWQQGDEQVRGNEAALGRCVAALEDGLIVAVKGVGGYHLMGDAASDEAVSRLRARKHRPHKPLAVMFPLAGENGLKAVEQQVGMRDEERAALIDPARPIVLLQKRSGFSLSQHLAPGLGELGAFLPYSPLHHLLLRDFGRPLVATSGNISGEPVLTDSEDAARRLRDIADAFLHHNRPIVRPADDSVVRFNCGLVRPIRQGRGAAPVELTLPFELAQPVLSCGGHMKNTVALAWGNRAVLSPHIGDLDSARSLRVFEQVIHDLQNLYGVKAEQLICDAHPGYASSRWAEAQNLPLHKVFHHMAHASALAAEHPQIENWLIFTWDGVGLGPDGLLWGGEALCGGPGRWQRLASFRPFSLMGGDKAGREPWRSAAALCWAAGIDYAPPGVEAEFARQAWRRGVNCMQTSAAGRLFDAAASLISGLTHASFEGQGPMQLEALAATAPVEAGQVTELPLVEDDNSVLRADWSPLLPMLMDDSLTMEQRAAKFHGSLARCLADKALRLQANHSFDAVGLTGGVFQNRLLASRATELLAGEGIAAYLPLRTPTNDGGIAFGQIVEAHHTSDAE